MKSMTPEELLSIAQYAVVSVSEEDGSYEWMHDITNIHEIAQGSAENRNLYKPENLRYEVVEINHGSGTDAIYARAFRALMRYVLCGLRQLDEQGDTESCTAYALRDVFTFAEGFLASADIDITSLLDGVTAQHHVRQRF